MPQLIASSGHAIALPSFPCRIGTSASNDILIQSGLGVAGHHATFHELQGHYVVEDSGSGLGTFVNHAPAQRCALQSGDLVRFGTLELRFQLANEVVPPASPAAPIVSAESITPEVPDVLQSPPSAMPVQKDLREGLPPVDNSTKEVPVSGLFPKPSQGDVLPNVESRRREKPRPPVGRRSASEPSPTEPYLGRLGSAQKSSQSSRKLPLAIGVGVMALVGGGWLVTEKPEWKRLAMERVGLSKGASETVPPLHSLTTPDLRAGDVYVSLAAKLANLTRPAAVISVDVAALRERGLTQGLPRLQRWLEKYLSLPMDDVLRVVALGASVEDFSMAIDTLSPITDEVLTERLGVADENGVYALDALSGPLVVRREGGSTLVVTHRDKAAQPLTVAPLPAALESRLQSAPGQVLFSLDPTMLERGNEPFMLGASAETLASKVVTLALMDTYSLQVLAQHATPALADTYAKGYSAAMQSSLSRLRQLDVSAAQTALRSMKTQVQDTTAGILWTLPEESKDIVQGLVEMIADPLGAEVADASVQVLRQEAQRVSALFYTAQKAKASLNAVTDVESAILALMAGVQGQADGWSDRVLRCRSFSKWEREVMAKFLEYDGASLTFRQDGQEPNESQAHPMEQAEASGSPELQARRDASATVDAFHAAKAAGADLSKAKDVDAVLAQLANGIDAGGSRISIDLADEEKERAKVFLRFSDGQIVLSDLEGE